MNYNARMFAWLLLPAWSQPSWVGWIKPINGWTGSNLRKKKRELLKPGWAWPRALSKNHLNPIT